MKKYVLLLCIVFCAIFSHGQSIKNIHFERDSLRLIIYYDIVSLIKGSTYNVNIFCSTDGGYTYSVLLKNAMGEIGDGVEIGKNKIVVWDVFKDVAGIGGMVSFRVTAEKNPVKKQYFIAYNGSIDAPIGLQFGMIGGVSPYIGIRLNSEFNVKNEYIYNETEYIKDYPYEDIYFVYGKDVKRPTYSFIAGVNAHVFKKAHLYLGAGYGVSKLLWEVNEYKYVDDELSTNNWVINNDWSKKGIEIESGIIFEYNNFLIKGGGSLLSFSRPTATFGLGFKF